MWNIDAYDIDLQAFNTENIENYLVLTKEIQEFLEFNSNKMFLVAPKGLGKSYLLRVKSHLYRQTSKGFKFIPEGPLCERFSNIKVNFTKEELNKYNDLQIWKCIWELSYYTLILKTMKEDSLPKEIRTLIGENGTLAEIVAIFLQNRGKIDKLHNLVAQHLKPAVAKLKENSHANQIAIFIDSIEEILDEPSNSTTDMIELKSDVWVNAQLSALLIAKDIVSLNTHIKIFLAIRSEAIEDRLGAMTLQLEAKSVFITYNKEQIKEIFEKNILLTNKEELVDPKNQNIIERLCGFSKIKHKFVHGKYGPIYEELFDFIYRHTYARPREIVSMGKAILRIDKVKREDHKIVGSEVNRISDELFNRQLRKEIIPKFNDTIFEAFIQKIENTAIEFSYAKRVEQEIKEEYEFEHTLSYFYNLGLLGVVENILDEDGRALNKQSFLSVGYYTLANRKMPDFKYCVLHPSLNKSLKDHHKNEFIYHKENIIGYENEFIFPSAENLAIEPHLHFGLDRDSLTCVLPELHGRKNLCVILMKRNEDWPNINKCNTFLLEVNEVEYHFRIYNSAFSDSLKDDIYLGWCEKKWAIVVINSEFNELIRFYKKSSAISFCIAKTIIPTLNDLIGHERGSRKHLYYCLREYISDEFQKIKKELNLNERITLEPVVIDRFQYSEERIPRIAESTTTCKISTEEYHRVYCLERADSSLLETEFVRRLSDSNVFNFVIKRQNLLVEGVYQFVKTLRFKNIKGRFPNIENDIIAEFINIQVNRLMKDINEDTYETMSEGKTKPQFKENLIKLASLTFERVFRLCEFHNISCDELNMEKTKQKGIFPDQPTFFRKIKKSPNYYKYSEPFIVLASLFEMAPLKLYHSLFISYSVKDRIIAVAIEQRLTLMGIEVHMYEKDNPTGHLAKYMTENVSANHRMLFIASKNSLTSDGCHFELSKCREEIRKQNDVYKLIPIRLDDYVLEVKDEEIPDEERRANVQMLRKINIKKYAILSEKFTLDQLDNELIKIVNNSLVVSE